MDERLQVERQCLAPRIARQLAEFRVHVQDASVLAAVHDADRHLLEHGPIAFLALADVSDRGQSANAFVCLDGGEAHVDRDFRAVLAQGRQGEPRPHASGLGALGVPRDMSRVRLTEVVGDQQIERLSLELITAVSEQALRQGVDTHDSPARCDH